MYHLWLMAAVKASVRSPHRQKEGYVSVLIAHEAARWPGRGCPAPPPWFAHIPVPRGKEAGPVSLDSLGEEGW